MDYKFQLILFVLLIYLLYGEPIEIEVTALTGLVNPKYDSKKSIFTFDILCEVNKNISNIIGKINIKIQVQKYPIDDVHLIDAICHIKPVRVAKNSVSETSLKCSFNTTDYPFIKEDTILIYKSNNGQDIETLNEVRFTFIKFEEISNLINANIESVNNINEENCIHNNYLFEINTDADFEENSLLESTICRVAISDDEFHQLARCVIPMKGSILKCYIDVEEKKYKKGDSIIIGNQDIVPCDNGQAINLLSNSKKVLNVIKECGETVFTNNNYLYFNEIFFSVLFVLILFD
mgnify:CR=1 FL=1